MAPSKRIYLSTAISGILSILLIIFIVFPLFKGIKETSQIFLSEKEKIASLAKEGEGFEKMKDFYKNYQSDFERIENVFVDPEVPIEFISFLEKNANTSQVQLKILSMTKKLEKTPTLPPPSQGAPDSWPSLLLQLSVTGSFSNFLKFLEKLENSPYLIEILDLNSRSLAEKELKTKELEGFPLADTNIFLTIKVFSE